MECTQQLPFGVMSPAEAAALPNSYDFSQVEPAAELAMSSSVEITFSVAHYADLGKNTPTNIAYAFAQPVRVESLADYMQAQEAHHRITIDEQVAALAASKVEAKEELPQARRSKVASHAGANALGVFGKLLQPKRLAFSFA